MNKVSFRIFIPEKKLFRWTPNNIVVIVWAITIFVCWIWQSLQPNSFQIALRNLFAIISFTISIYFLIISYKSLEPLKGSLLGILSFEKDKIAIDETTYLLKEIYNVSFRFNNYYKESQVLAYKDFNGILSRGVNNYIEFTDNKNQTHEIYFEVVKNDDFKLLYTFVDEAVRLNRMTFKDAVNLIGIENVSTTP